MENNEVQRPSGLSGNWPFGIQDFSGTMFIESSYIVMQEYGQIQEYTVVLEII